MVEIGCVEIFNRVETGRTSTLISIPSATMPSEAEAVHGLTNDLPVGQAALSERAEELLEFIEDSPLVAHNAASTSASSITSSSNAAGRRSACSRMVDTLVLARIRHPGAKHSLDALCMRFGIDRSHRVKHGALLDAQLLAQVYVELTGGRQIGLGLVADSRRVAVAAAPAGDVREPRPPRPHHAAAEELERHRAFIASWSTRSGHASPRPVDARFGAVLSGPPSRGASQVDVRVAGHQVDTGESLREHAIARIEEITEKYFRGSIGANVTFGRGPNNDFTCDIVAPVVQGVVLKARTARASADGVQRRRRPDRKAASPLHQPAQGA
jgi:DNA polymerase-3 subunit epsilon